MLSIKRWRRWKRWNAIAQRIPGVRLRYVVLGCRFAAALLSRYWVQPSKRVLLVSATLSKAALRAFDAQYSRALTPPADRVKNHELPWDKAAATAACAFGAQISHGAPS